MVKKAHQHNYFHRHEFRGNLSNFERCTMEGILVECIPAWYSNSSALDRLNLERVVNIRHLNQEGGGTVFKKISACEVKQVLFLRNDLDY